MALVVVVALVFYRVMDSSGQGVAKANVAGVQIKPAVSVSQPLLPGLEDGACVSLAPTSGHVGQTVFIDAGHGFQRRG